ncbi:type VII secretion protein EccB [Streptomyces sp. AC627_RSS907]|uniref:type VII secretion protein EccB n=1 Tax=Streptomyces sp. AC627_RSS907 TaxID=2823684 RepID=UPI001C2669A6|nr:type VII secretion protein EccB [Streptomyces sp. AC627_RSS907]
MVVQSRKDQVQAHLYVMGRLASGLLRDDPDSPDTPTARTWRGLRWGALLVVLACVVTVLYGLIRPGGGTSWRTPGALVVVKDTGARYLNVGGTLHPVLNEASARLVAGNRMTVEQAVAQSLEDAPRGAPIGIVGAPDGLPAAPGPATWAVCAGVRPADAAGGTRPLTSVVVAGPKEAGDGLGSDRGVLVTAPGEGRQLVWNGRRFPVDTTHGTVAALGWAGVTPVPVSASFLTALDAGPGLAPPVIAGRGRPGPELAGGATRVGQLFSAGGQHYVLRTDGLAPLTGLARRLLLGDPRTQDQAYDGRSVVERPIGPADLAAHQAPASASQQLAAGLPDSVPEVATVDPAQEQVCARVAPSAEGHTTTVALVPAAEVPGSAPTAQPGVTAPCVPVDRTWVRPGTGTLVRARSSAGTGDSLYLVTESGVSYPVTAAGLKQLGYPAGAAVDVPDRLLNLLPSGPVLDPSAVSKGEKTDADTESGRGCQKRGGGSPESTTNR